MSLQEPVRFFFGANTPTGFFGYHKTDLYDPRDGWVAFLIKSGAGTGKATFMREVLNDLTAMDVESECIYCSSDPQSLDAVRFPTLKLCVIDATAPHILEPVAYGECEQLVPFGCCLKPSVALHQTDAWFAASDACSDGHARCCRFMAAAHSLLENNRRIQSEALLDEKLVASATRVASREAGQKSNKRGRETRRFLSAITPQGPLFYRDTVCALCPKLYVLEDEYGAVSDRYLRVLREAFLERGLDIITGACPLAPQAKLEHLLIPSLGVGFITSNSHHSFELPVYRRIHAARFLQAEPIKAKKQQLRFNRRASTELLCEAVAASADAKSHHDRMEELHIGAMDWTMWRTIADGAKASLINIAEERLSAPKS